MFQAVGAVRCAYRIFLTSLAIVASMALGMASATAAQRYAAPGGSPGPACPQITPCSLEVAVEGAGNGDEVIVGPGVHAAGSNEIIASASNLVIHGAPGAAKPEITSTAANAINVAGSNVTIRDLKLAHLSAPGLNAALLLSAGSAAERLEVTSPALMACAVTDGATIRDSVCRSTGTNAGALVAVGVDSTSGYARNVTAVATGSGTFGALALNLGSSGTVELDARNVVAEGPTDVGTGAGTGTKVVTLSHSAYSTTFPPNSALSSITPAGTAMNIVAPPLFVSATDYHQLAASPTRNAGAADSRTGTLDIDGEARVQAAIDIGADEFTEPVVNPPPPDDTTPPSTTIDKSPKKKTKSKNATFVFGSDESGSTFVCKLDKKEFSACTSPLKLKRLKKGMHTFTVVATDAAGNADATPETYMWKVKKKRKERKR